ncbi:hypothetical protein [uncultured Thiohalocapsa sp.]|uniref:choice-of-anchor Y domain-containing protein n=1 Tax=uncultured Thiohalocapsa sp. TaxID=768990 RepID=UPI0025D61B07|nr:hypothetical protein [uncultured Thiohalocapsa sp.]
MNFLWAAFIARTRPVRLLLLLLLFGQGAAQASLIVLYDSTQSTLPQAQPWLDYAASPGVTPTLTGSGTAVDTRDDPGAFAGFSTHSFAPTHPTSAWQPKHPSLPALDARENIGLAFELALLDEARLRDDRAGFTLLLLDRRALGVELNFWDDAIWAQGADHDGPAELASFATIAGSILYELSVTADGYDLWADGTRLMGGPLRRFDADALLPGLHGTPSIIYLGDASTDAASSYAMGDVLLAPRLFTTTPSPATAALLLAGLLGMPLVARLRRRSLRDRAHRAACT